VPVAYDEELAERVRGLAHGERGASEKMMFGGLATLVNGNMAVAVRSKGGLLVRVPDDQEDDALAEPGAALAVMQGRPMSGWFTVAADGCRTDADLARWVARGLTVARGLPPKNAATAKKAGPAKATVAKKAAPAKATVAKKATGATEAAAPRKRSAKKT
jgi:TfoX/Sxy family transcriptional regulator of competence genes